MADSTEDEFAEGSLVADDDEAQTTPSPTEKERKASRAGSRNKATAQIKQRLLGYISDGLTVEDALRRVQRSMKTWEYYRATDKEFAAKVDAIRAAKLYGGRVTHEDNLKLDFAAFRREYLGMETFPHQQNIIDMLEGNTPRWLHPSMVFEPGRPNYVLVNVPPEHCAEVSTPVLTESGWKTVGEVNDGDRVLGYDGLWWPVVETWSPDGPVELYTVRFNTGDEITTDGDHKWVLWDYHGRQHQVTTRELFAKPMLNKNQRWRIPVARPYDGDDVELPLDPYLLGYWLGDGDSNGYRIAVSDGDLMDLVQSVAIAGHESKYTVQRGGYSLYVYGMTKPLRDMNLIRNKRIPDVYFTASHQQRLALLQGLMDSDGTITVKDSVAKWTQHDREDLCRDVYRLIASLGYQPRWRKYAPSRAFHTDATVSNEITFRTQDEPVFRLARKSRKQKLLGEYTKTAFRTIESVLTAGTGEVKCLTTTGPGNLFAIGDGLLLTHNAKSMTTSIDYPVYRICMDPNVRILIVSKSQTKAAEFLYAIKQRLTHPFYSKLQVAYAAGSGFKSKTATWQANTVYLGEELRDSAEKDPTIQALGIGGQVYGARADLIILDDCVTLSNAHEYEKQIRWIQQEVLTRIGPGGKLLVLGTRVDSVDLYRELRNPERYPTGTSPWSYLAMPAVLEFTESQNDWVTLWPESDRPWQGDEDAKPNERGMYPRWDGHHLGNRRAALDPRTWSMVYQQADVDEDAVFSAVCVKGSINRVRRIGPLVAGLPGHPERTDGMMVFAGLDPAIVGDTAAIVMAVDRHTKKRYVLDAQVITRPTPQQIRDLITTLTEKYRPSEWMVERNAFQGYLTQDEGLRSWMANRGVLLREHTTSRNKWDVGFGVAAMSTLFGTVEGNGRHHRDNLLELPADRHEGVRMLVDQLITWSPETKNKTDLVMALWFCEIRAKEICQYGSYGGNFLKNPFLSRADQNKRLVVNLDEWAAENGNRMSVV